MQINRQRNCKQTDKKPKDRRRTDRQKQTNRQTETNKQTDRQTCLNIPSLVLLFAISLKLNRNKITKHCFATFYLYSRIFD